MAELTPRQLAGWMAFYAVEPFGEQEAWWRLCFLRATILNLFRRRGQREIQPKELMPPGRGPTTVTRLPRERQTAEEQKAVFFSRFPKLKQQYEERQQRARTS